MKRFLFLLLCLILTGCATYTKGDRFGYSDFRITEDIFTISFKGKANCSLEQAEKLALRRSSEVTLENGFKYFVVLEKTSDTKRGLFNTSTGSATAYGYGNTANAYGSSSGFAFPINMPVILLKIKCFKEKPIGEYPEVISAEQFLNYNFPELKQDAKNK